MGKGMAPDEFDRILKLYMEWILFSDSQMYILMGQKQLSALASNNLATFQVIVSSTYCLVHNYVNFAQFPTRNERICTEINRFVS